MRILNTHVIEVRVLSFPAVCIQHIQATMFYVVGCMVKYAKRLFKAGDDRNEKILRLKVTSFICFVIVT